MHFALLIGYGASAINPYLAIETLEDMSRPADVTDGAQELHEGHQQGTAQGLLEDGHLDAAELSRRADLRSHRPEPASWSTGTSPAPLRASKASAWMCWPREAIAEARARLPSRHRIRHRAGRRRQLSVPRRAANITCCNPLTISKLQHAVRQESSADLPGIHRPDRPPEPPALHAARPARVQASRRARCRSKKSSRPAKSSSASPPAPCRSARSARKRTRRWPSP